MQRRGDLRRRVGGGGGRPAPPARGGAHRRRGVAGPGARGGRPGALAPAEAKQASGGGGNPRFGAIFDERRPATLRRPPSPRASWSPTGPSSGAAVDRCARSPGRVVHDRSTPATVGAASTGAADALAVDGGASRSARRGRRRAGRARARPVAAADGSGSWPSTAVSSSRSTPTPRGRAPSPTTPPAPTGRVRLVTLTDAVTAGGRSRAQAAAQLARAARRATEDRVGGVRGERRDGRLDGRAGGRRGRRPTWSAAPRRSRCRGAELVAGAGWFGLRSHPARAAASRSAVRGP